MGQRSPINRKCLACMRLRDAARRKLPEVRERYRISSAQWYVDNKVDALSDKRKRYAEDEAYREDVKAKISDAHRRKYAEDEVYRRKRIERTAEYHRQRTKSDPKYAAHCSAKAKANREKRLKDPDYIKRIRSPEHKAKVAKSAAARYQRPSVKKRHNENGRAWCALNPDKIAAKASRRRADKDQRTPPWLTPEHHKLILGFYHEARTLTEDTGVQHQVDHIIPLRGSTVSGLHVPWNLQVLTAAENLKKGNRLTQHSS